MWRRAIEAGEPQALFALYRLQARIDIVRLTDKEVSLLAVVAHGWTGEEVAAITHYHPDTIKDQLKAIRLKMGAKNTLHAVTMAIRQGYLAQE